MLISQFPGIKSSIIETSEILHSTLWGKNKEKGEGVLWALRGKWEFQMKGRAFFLMNRRFVPDVTFVCRDLQLRAVWCVAGWGVVKGGVEHTGRRILRYSSRPRHFPQNTESHLLNQHKHIWTSVQHIPGIHCKTTQNLVCFKSKNNDFIIHWGAFVSWQILTLVVRRLGTPPPNFPLNLFLFLSFFSSFSIISFLLPSLLLNQNLEVIYEVRMGFLPSRSGYLSRAQWGGTPVWRPTPPIKGIASEWSRRTQCWKQLWIDVWL